MKYLISSIIKKVAVLGYYKTLSRQQRNGKKLSIFNWDRDCEAENFNTV